MGRSPARPPPRLRRTTLALRSVLAVLALGSACTPDEPAPSVYLIVQATSQQPASPALGTIVVLQSKGGKRLRIRSEAGTHRFTTSDRPRALSCIPSVEHDLYFTVAPTEVEALLYVDLLGDGAIADPEAAGAGGGGGTGGGATSAGPSSARSKLEAACPGEALKTAVVPITNVRSNPAEPDAGSGGGQAGAGGSGGTGGAAGRGGGAAGGATGGAGGTGGGGGA